MQASPPPSARLLPRDRRCRRVRDDIVVARATDLAKPPVYVLGAATCTDHSMITTMPDLTVTAGAVSGPAAFKEAGITTDDVDVLMGYDSFTITALLHLEDLGFCAKGEGGAFVEDGQARARRLRCRRTRTAAGCRTRTPDSTACSCWSRRSAQLRGECGHRQVPGPQIAVAHGSGGVLSTMATIVLGTGATLMSTLVEPPAVGRGRTVLGGDATVRARSAVVPSCEQPFWYPRAVCPRVSSDAIDWRRAQSGRDRVCGECSTSPRPGTRCADGPYVVALVDLDRGGSVMGNVVACVADEVHVGMPVRVTGRPLSDGRQLAAVRTDQRVGTAAKEAPDADGDRASVRTRSASATEVRRVVGGEPSRRSGGRRSSQLHRSAGPDIDDWATRLHEAGFLCVGWPKEYGGRGLSGVEVAVMNEEFGRAGIPRVTRGMGEWLVGPSIIVQGTEEQKAHFLPRIVDGTDRYCQGFSEPDAGSDLAALKTAGRSSTATRSSSPDRRCGPREHFGQT